MSSDVVKLVTFRLGEDLFAADVGSVDRVVRYEAPNAVPDLPPWIAGVLEHRGKVIPVVDLRVRIELPKAPVTADTRIVVLNTADGWVGAVVDSVLEVVAIPPGGISPPPTLFRGLSGRFLRGIARVNGQLVVVLDVERMLATVDPATLARARGDGEAVTRG